MEQPSILTGEFRPDFLLHETLANVFKTTAAAYPNAIALIFHDHPITYKQLDLWSDTVALELIKKGFGNGQRIGVWLPRGVELHVAILGILKAGAAYVPMDIELPQERVITVLTECAAIACFTNASLEISISLLHVIKQKDALLPVAYTPVGSKDNEAYILYTSGSTGKPKGIPISQRQICHWLRAEQSLLQINTTDIVYQGFSVSFDMWCEETWISYLAGATLIIADATEAKAIDELPDLLKKNNVTVLHAVPSLLAVMDEHIPSIRLINAGGEACTAAVLKKWSKPGLIFFNSYGPTETTVTASMIRLHAGDTITIGKPLPNYNFVVLDENKNIVPRGTQGELGITGPGVGEGYVHLPELTEQKFITKPATLSDLPGEKIYLTGDAAIIQPAGTVELQGRLDDQVKLRGYRIELGEIENQLSKQAHVLAAAVALKKDSNGMEELVGYVQFDNAGIFDETIVREALAKVVPVYMVPAIVMQLKELPRLTSGKINRKALPVPEALLTGTSASNDEPINREGTLEEKVTVLLKKVFPNKTVTPSMDFFTDLGGHSLLAATFVSRLRKEANVTQVSLKDVYQHRPIQALINYWEATEKTKTAAAAKEKFQSVSFFKYLMCWIAQSISLLIIFGLFGGQVFFPYLGYYYTQQETTSHTYAVMVAFLLFCLIPPLLVILSIILKWLVIGKVKEGDYPLWGSYYFKWWFVSTIQELVQIQFLSGTPLYPRYLRLCGMKVSKDAQISSIKIGAADLITIGKDVSISSNVVLNNVRIKTDA